MKTTITTAIRIKADFGYYPGTYNAPQDGYIMGCPKYDSRTGRESCLPLEFETVEDACDYLTESSNYDAMHCEYDGNGDFSRSGQYVTNHGQHSRPVYTIVSAKSGRCSKAIKAACDLIQSKED
jgi:hypothetical protein